MSILEVEAVHTYYGSSHVLHGLDMRIDQGQIVAVLGRKRCREDHACAFDHRFQPYTIRKDSLQGRGHFSSAHSSYCQERHRVDSAREAHLSFLNCRREPGDSGAGWGDLGVVGREGTVTVRELALQAAV